MAADPQPRSSEQPPTAAPKPSSFDHVALWVSQREALADLACRHLGMHEIERTDSFTLVGVDARLGKLTLFDAPGPRAAGALSRVALRVDDVEAALGRLPAALAVATAADGVPELAAPDGLRIGLVPTRDGQTSFDLDHVLLGVPDVPRTADRLAQMGFDRAGEALAIADRHVRLGPAPAAAPVTGERPLLNHLALLVDDVRGFLAASDPAVAVDEFKDAPNTFAAFVTGPAGVRIEYVEHKPGFSLV
ncbi:MAG: VOC family protein [Actinobacteria bacterium]|nr:MAG: VOC family protein [Actinomycetota bacterium]